MLPMYLLTVKDVNGINDFTDVIGRLFVMNHSWKIRVREMPQFQKETTIKGRELQNLIENGIKSSDSSFSALEGDQILFRIAISDKCIIHTTRKHWVTFFEEKFSISGKEELDPDMPEFNEFMQD